MSSYFGSICLSDIPRSQMKKVMCKDGKERIFLNIFVGEKRKPVTFDGRTYTHYVSCAPKKEERKEGEQYYIGELQTFSQQPSSPTPEQIDSAPSVGVNDDLPF